MSSPHRSQEPGLFDDSFLPLLAAFLLALAFLGGVVALLSSGGSKASATSAPTTTTTTVTDDGPNASTPARIVRVTLTVTSTGDGRGTVRIAGGPARKCEDGCIETYEEGVSVTLLAREAAGSTFVGWTGSCSSRRACTVTMNESRSATALFALANTDLDADCSDAIDNDDDGLVDDRDPECAIGNSEQAQIAPAAPPVVPPVVPQPVVPPPVVPPPVVPPPPIDPPPIVPPPIDIPPPEPIP